MPPRWNRVDGYVVRPHPRVLRSSLYRRERRAGPRLDLLHVSRLTGRFRLLDEPRYLSQIDSRRGTGEYYALWAIGYPACCQAITPPLRALAFAYPRPWYFAA